MNEVVVRTNAPAAIVVLEVEAPPRIALVADGEGETDALVTWIGWTPSAAEAILAAIADLDARGGLERSAAWHIALNKSDRRAV